MNLDAIVTALGNNLAVVVGAVMGSTKAQVLSQNNSMIARIINILVGIFAGVSLAFHYTGQISPWGAAVLSLVASSMAVAVIDAMSGMAPEIVHKLVEKWFGIQGTKPK